MTLSKHTPLFVTPFRESKDSRIQRSQGIKDHKELRSEKGGKRKGVSKSELELVNLFRLLGFDYLSLGERAFDLVPYRLEGSRVSRYSSEALEFLNSDFNVEQRPDKEGRFLLHFKSQKETKGERMNFYKAVAEVTEGLTSKQVRKVWEGVVTIIQTNLETERKARLPEVGIVNLAFKPAREGGKKVPNRFKPGEFWKPKAKKACNKLKIRPAKSLRVFADDLPVVDPNKKSKKKKSKK